VRAHGSGAPASQQDVRQAREHFGAGWRAPREIGFALTPRRCRRSGGGRARRRVNASLRARPPPLPATVQEVDLCVCNRGFLPRARVKRGVGRKRDLVSVSPGSGAISSFLSTDTAARRLFFFVSALSSRASLNKHKPISSPPSSSSIRFTPCAPAAAPW